MTCCCSADLSSAAVAEVSYTEERGRRLLYRDEGLHLEVLQLVFTLIFNESGQLDSTYCDQYPWERKLQVQQENEGQGSADWRWQEMGCPKSNAARELQQRESML